MRPCRLRPALGSDGPLRTWLRCRQGRVLQQGSMDAAEQGLYVVGWAKRGPTGIIGVHACSLPCGFLTLLPSEWSCSPPKHL